MKSIKIKFNDYLVSGILNIHKDCDSLLVLGHGAGAGMTHSFMEQLALDLEEVGIASLRYNFPYMEQGRRSPNSPKISQQTVRAAVDRALEIAPDLTLLAGGKSYGGRMSAQAQAEEPLNQVKALVFFGFPLHAPGKPGDKRGEHLFDIKIPMLFLQGTRDNLALLELMQPLVSKLGSRATLDIVEGADHGFSVLKSNPLTTAEIRKDLAARTRNWLDRL